MSDLLAQVHTLDRRLDALDRRIDELTTDLLIINGHRKDEIAELRRLIGAKKEKRDEF